MLREIAFQSCEPFQFVVVLNGPHFISVGYVRIDDRNSVNIGAHQSRIVDLGEVVVESIENLLRLPPCQYGHTVIRFHTSIVNLIPSGTENQKREEFVLTLRFLDAQNIRFVFFEPRNDCIQADTNRIDVVCRNFHYKLNGYLAVNLYRLPRTFIFKNVPVRSTKVAESYAKKVRLEPPKETRQEDPRTKRLRARVGGQHDHGPAQVNKNKKP